MEITSAFNYRQEIIDLLKSAKLPTEDLPGEMDDFLTILNNDQPIAAAGIERYADYGLLRSVVVSPEFRKKGVAAQLLKAIEELAAGKGIKVIYLLTETAPEYFGRRGFEQLERVNIPAELQQSSEFSHVCPQSAIAMKKNIGTNQ